MNNSDSHDNVLSLLFQLLVGKKEEAFQEILSTIYNVVMSLERENHLRAGNYERKDGRDGYANGYKPRTLQTRIGTLDLLVPQVRNSSHPFYPQCLTQGVRSERALYLAAAEMYVKGVSTRQVESVFAQMGVDHFSSEQVSRASQMLDDEIQKWRTREITTAVPVLFLDATYQKVRLDGVVTDVATFVVSGVYEDGHRAILAVDSDCSEAEIHWRRVLEDLRKRGVQGVKLIVSDAHAGLAAAREAVFTGVPWQRCQFHLQQNAQAQITKQSLKEEVGSEIRAIFNAPSLEEATRLMNNMVAKYQKEQPKLASWLEQNLSEGFTVFKFPEQVRRKLRTNNIAERINKSIKARTRRISVFPSQESQLRLVSSICMEISDSWESGKVYLKGL